MNKKVLIISKEAFDPSTEEVIDWLTFNGHQFIRVNGDYFEKNDSSINIFLNNESDSISINGQHLTLIYSYWIRRWSDHMSMKDFLLENGQKGTDFLIATSLALCLAADTGNNYLYLTEMLKVKKHLTSPTQLGVNKIQVLIKASQLGFPIPETLITTSRVEISDFHAKHGKIICKDLEGSFIHTDDHSAYISYTELLSLEEINELPENFVISLFQEYIEKEIELRVFFLKDKYYCMAIFSQENSQTEVDFRKYSFEKPVRTVPYLLPPDIKTKLSQLMELLGLETGSIDIIKSKSGKYYFLEVNPVGQFGMISKPCNYPIEKEIAEYLTT